MNNSNIMFLIVFILIPVNVYADSNFELNDKSPLNDIPIQYDVSSVGEPITHWDISNMPDSVIVTEIIEIDPTYGYSNPIISYHPSEFIYALGIVVLTSITVSLILFKEQDKLKQEVHV